MESNGLNANKKVAVYTIQGDLLLESDEEELNRDDFRIIFQSDLVLESSGQDLYIFSQKQEKSFQNEKIN